MEFEDLRVQGEMLEHQVSLDQLVPQGRRVPKARSANKGPPGTEVSRGTAE